MILYPVSLHITANKDNRSMVRKSQLQLQKSGGKSFSMFTTKQNIRYAYV